MDKNVFLSYFSDVPVAVNNLYGDPFLPSQKENTFVKLHNLSEVRHTGVVALITKTEITEEDAMRLASFSSNLNLIVFVSISELGSKIEKIPGNRYKTLALCKERGIPIIAYVRPFIRGEYGNASLEKVRAIFDKISEFAGLDCAVVVSGLRGNENVFSSVGYSAEDMKKLSYRVKIVPPDVRTWLQDCSKGFTVFERTSCGVAFVLGNKFSRNPYYASPQLAKCEQCPLKETCFDVQDSFTPTEEDIELVNLLGYSAKLELSQNQLCRVEPFKRTECKSCCTSCFLLARKAIDVSSSSFELNLGDIGLLRHLTHRLVRAKGVVDNQKTDIAIPQNPFLRKLPIYITNSWWSYSRNTNSCYKCAYCLVPEFKNQEKEYGEVPVVVGEKIWEQIENKK